MYVTIQQATMLTGKSRATITRHISSGKLSKTNDGIDLAELMRVYGALVSTPDTSLIHQKNDSMTTHDVSGDASKMHQNAYLIDELRSQISLLKEQVAREQSQSDHWRKTATMLLEHQPQKPEPEVKTESRLFNKLFGNRSK